MSLLVQSLGVLGVIGSLIFVGIEVKQNSVAVRSASDSEFADAFQELNLVMASNESLAKVLGRDGYLSREALDPIEREFELQLCSMTL